MNKEKIISLLKKYNFDKEDYIILSGMTGTERFKRNH